MLHVLHAADHLMCTASDLLLTWNKTVKSTVQLDLTGPDRAGPKHHAQVKVCNSISSSIANTHLAGKNSWKDMLQGVLDEAGSGECLANLQSALPS